MSDQDKTLRILLDHQMAQLGDAFVNFIYSLALTRRYNRPIGRRIGDRVLADAARIAKIRQLLPKRTSRGDVANAIEALLIHTWLNRSMTIDEMTEILQSYDSASTAFAELAGIALRKLRRA